MHRVCFASLFLSLAAALATPALRAQERGRDENYRKADWDVLEKDPRLTTIVSFELQNAKVKQILRLLQQLTGVSLTADTQTLNQTLGGLEAEEMPAWEVMRQIVLTDGVKGGWKKSGDGYTLQVQIEPETAPAPPPPESTKWWIFALPGVAVLLVSTGGYLYRSGTRKAGPKDKKK